MMKAIKTKTIRQGPVFKASPHEVYETLMDSKKHAKFSGAAARISRKVGGSFSVYDGWATGKNLQLKKDKLIVQKWRGDDWPKGVYSTVKFMLQKSGKNTKMMFTQIGVPANKYKDISEGWKEHYWEPMKEMLER